MSRKTIWDEVAIAAEKYILKAEKDSGNTLRQRYTDIMSAREWNNREFNDLVDDMVDSLPNIEKQYAKSSWDELDIIEKAAQVIVDGHFAASCLSDERVMRDVPRAVEDEMRDAEQDYRDAVRGKRSSRDDRDRNYRDSGRDDRRRDDRGSRDRTDRSRNSRDDRPRRGAGGTAVASGLEAIFGLEENERKEDDARLDREEDEELSRAKRTTSVVRDDPETIIEAVAKVNKSVEGPDYTKARPFDEFWMGGEHWKVAFLSNWRLTGDGSVESTIPKLYNVNTHIKYYVKNAENEVREEFMEVSDETRYLQHQTQYAPDERPEVRGTSAGISLSGKPKDANNGSLPYVNDGSYQEPKSVNLADALESISGEQTQFTGANQADSLVSAVFTSRARLAKEDDESRLDFHLLRTPVLASSFDQVSLIDDVYNSNTLTDAHQKLNALKPKFDPQIWDTLNRRYSSTLLRATKYQFQFDRFEKLSFAKHFPTVIEMMRKERDAESASAYASRIGFVSALACGHVSVEEIQAGTLSDLIEDPSVPAAVFVDIIAIASFKGSTDQLGLGNMLDTVPTGVSITPTAHKRLNDTLRSLYTKLDNQVPSPGKVRLYLSTKDNRLVEVLPYYGRSEVFILALVE